LGDLGGGSAGNLGLQTASKNVLITDFSRAMPLAIEHLNLTTQLGSAASTVNDDAKPQQNR